MDGKDLHLPRTECGFNLQRIAHNLKALGYKSDITYGVHSEFGFDYLWDNKGQMLEEKVQRGHHYASLMRLTVS